MPRFVTITCQPKTGKEKAAFALLESLLGKLYHHGYCQASDISITSASRGRLVGQMIFFDLQGSKTFQDDPLLKQPWRELQESCVEPPIVRRRGVFAQWPLKPGTRVRECVPSVDLCMKLGVTYDRTISACPVHCLTHSGIVSLHHLGPEEELRSLLRWRWNAETIDNLWIDSGAYEKWAAHQIWNVDSSLNAEGREIAESLSERLGLAVEFIMPEQSDLFPYTGEGPGAETC